MEAQQSLMFAARTTSHSSEQYKQASKHACLPATHFFNHACCSLLSTAAAVTQPLPARGAHAPCWPFIDGRCTGGLMLSVKMH